MKKTIPEDVLRMLGFRKTRKQINVFPPGTWRNESFSYGGLFYNPKIHSVRQFYHNLLMNVFGMDRPVDLRKCVDAVNKIMKGKP